MATTAPVIDVIDPSSGKKLRIIGHAAGALAVILLRQERINTALSGQIVIDFGANGEVRFSLRENFENRW